MSATSQAPRGAAALLCPDPVTLPAAFTRFRKIRTNPYKIRPFSRMRILYFLCTNNLRLNALKCTHFRCSAGWYPALSPGGTRQTSRGTQRVGVSPDPTAKSLPISAPLRLCVNPALFVVATKLPILYRIKRNRTVYNLVRFQPRRPNDLQQCTGQSFGFFQVANSEIGFVSIGVHSWSPEDCAKTVPLSRGSRSQALDRAADTVGAAPKKFCQRKGDCAPFNLGKALCAAKVSSPG